MGRKKHTTLCIGCSHSPYHHKDFFKFMSAIKSEYCPTRVRHLGDESDWHSISYHEPVPNLPAPGDELRAIRRDLKKLNKIFPEMILIYSNHGSLPKRKLQSAGLPEEMLKSENEIYEIDSGWSWQFDLLEDDIYYHHGMNSNAVNVSKTKGVNVVQAHYHSQMHVTYYATLNGPRWAMQTGTCADQGSMAMAYGRNNMQGHAMGCGIIVDGRPRNIPMLIDHKGNWIRKV